MTATETRPDAEVTEVTPVPSSGLEAWLGASDHKAVGRLYLLFGSIFGLAGAALGLVVNLDRVDLGELVIARDVGELVQLWSASRDLLLVGGVLPLLVGLGLYVVPLQVGSSALAFGRGAAASFWTWLVATGILALSYLVNGGPAGGAEDAVVLWILSLGAAIVALLWALVAIATTVLTLRAPGMTLSRVPATAWSYLLFAVLGLLSLAPLLGFLVLAYLDTRYGWVTGIEDRTTFTSIVDRISLAPAVYLTLVPTLGIAVDAITTLTGRAPRAHKGILGAIGLLTVVSFGADLLGPAWDGIAPDHNGLRVALVAIAVLPVLAVLGLAGESLRFGSVKLRGPLLGGLVAGLLALLAVVMGLVSQIASALILVENEFDTDLLVPEGLTVAGTSYADGLRVLVLGASLVAVVAGTQLWSIKLFGRTIAEPLSLLALAATAGGALLWGAGEIVSGMLEQPGLPAFGSDVEDGVEALNALSAAGAALLAGGLGLLALNLIMVMVLRSGSAAEPWRGLTLEWSTDNPPPVGNFATQPTVTSATPLADDETEEV